MIVKSLDLLNFRNYEEESFVFDPGTNVLFGNNAQGKTNVLEALFVGSTTKSHQGSKDNEMIRKDVDEAHLRLIIQKNGIDCRIDMHLKRHRAKGIAIDGVKVRKSAELMGLSNMVFFSPEDLSMIKNGPSERRRFLDMELCQLDQIYMKNLSAYQKVIQQRNNLLKLMNNDRNYGGSLFAWDEKLIEYGNQIINTRKLFVEELNEVIKKIHSKLTADKEVIEVKYEPNVEPDYFAEQIKQNRERDIILKSTTVGPHRDDLAFYINGENARKYGSQGQKRTVALSLKLSEIEIVKHKIKELPVLLLDDVLSELDRSRQTQLLESIQGIQTIVTCTGLEEFINQQIKIQKVFEIINGKVKA